MAITNDLTAEGVKPSSVLKFSESTIDDCKED
jgi:hypothetical protein